MQFVVLEICNDVPSVNLITNDIMVARHRLSEVALENEVTTSDEIKYIMDGSITGCSSYEYSVEILEYD